MITSKRDLKKYIHRVEDEVSQVVVPAAVCAKVYSEEKAMEIWSKLAEASLEALDRISIGFDKTPDAFESMAAYKKARKQYFREAYAKVVNDYEAAVNKLISTIEAGK